MIEETGKDFLQTRIDCALDIVEIGPCLNARIARWKLGVLRDNAQLFLALEGLFTDLVPTLVELSLVFVGPLL